MSHSVQVKKGSGAVMIYGLSMQATAAHLCDRFRQNGVQAAIGIQPGVPGYQVVVHQLGLSDVKSLLRQLGVDTQDDA